MTGLHITAIVLNWNGVGYIADCLKSLLAVKTGPHQLEIVIVDNDSSDNSIEFIAKNFPTCTLIRNPTNLGYAAGNNTGLKYALSRKSDFIWIVNPDITVAPDALEMFIAGAAQFPHGGIFGGKIYFTPGYEFHKDRYTKKDLGKVFWYAGGLIDWGNLIASHRGVDQVDSEQLNRDLETDFVTGACMFIRRRVLEQVGLFDPKYFLYYEENDLCQRAHRSGFKLIFLYEPKAWHANAQATGMGSALQDYFLTRNRMLFGLHFASLYTKFALIRESISLYRHGRPWQRRAILDFYQGKFGVGSYQN